jgi:Insertion element 4 transposase N-terminal
LPGQCVITREIAVAEGVFAPGHLGELTQIVPFEMVDAVLSECGAAQRRLRKLPARVVVYLLLAAALFEECGYAAVWARLTAALGPLSLPPITATGLWHARARLGVRPMRALFDLLRGPAAAIGTAGARWAGLLVVAIDGTSLDVPDDPATRARLGKGSASTPPPPATRRSCWSRWWPAAPGRSSTRCSARAAGARPATGSAWPARCAAA